MTPLSVRTRRFPAPSRTTSTGPSSDAAVGATLLGGGLPATVEIVFWAYATFANRNNKSAEKTRTEYGMARSIGSVTTISSTWAHEPPPVQGPNLLQEDVSVTHGYSSIAGEQARIL